MGHSTTSGRTQTERQRNSEQNLQTFREATARRRANNPLEAGNRALEEALARETARRRRNNDNREARNPSDLDRQALLTVARAYGMDTRWMEDSRMPTSNDEIVAEIMTQRRRLQRQRQ